MNNNESKKSLRIVFSLFSYEKYDLQFVSDNGFRDLSLFLQENEIIIAINSAFCFKKTMQHIEICTLLYYN